MHASTSNMDRVVFYESQVAMDDFFKANHGDIVRRLKKIEGTMLFSQPHVDGMLVPVRKYLESKTEDLKALFCGNDIPINYMGEYCYLRKRQHVAQVCGSFLERDHLFTYDRASFTDLAAFQAVITAIYDYAHNKLGIGSSLAPLARWGHRPELIFTLCKTKINTDLGISNDVPNDGDPDNRVGSSIVFLPFRYKNGGTCAWTILGHEVAHITLDSDKRIIAELTQAMKNELEKELQKRLHLITESDDPKIGEFLFIDKYLYYDKESIEHPGKPISDLRLEELISDVMGVLFGSPAFGIGLIGYLKGLRGKQLSDCGHCDDTHPFGLLRALTVANIAKGSSENN